MKTLPSATVGAPEIHPIAWNDQRAAPVLMSSATTRDWSKIEMNTSFPSLEGVLGLAGLLPIRARAPSNPGGSAGAPVTMFAFQRSSPLPAPAAHTPPA